MESTAQDNNNHDSVENKEAPELQIKELFDKLIGDRFDAEKNYIITKQGTPENIILILKFLSSSPPPLQLSILHDLISLLFKSTRNLYICQHLNVLGVLLEMLPTIQDFKVFEKAAFLIQILGKFSMNIKQLNSLLFLLFDGTEDRKVPH